MRKSLLPLCCIVAAGFVIQTSASDAILSTQQQSDVAKWAIVHGLPQDKVATAYSQILGDDIRNIRTAAGFLAEQKAYEPIAAALLTTSDFDTRVALAKELMTKPDYSRQACSALLRELETLNATISESDEIRAGSEAAKKQIASVVARWLQIQDPAIALDSFHSQGAYALFSTTARSKMAEMPEPAESVGKWGLIFTFDITC